MSYVKLFLIVCASTSSLASLYFGTVIACGADPRFPSLADGRFPCPKGASLSPHTRERIPLARREIHRVLSLLAGVITFLPRSKGVSGVYRVDVAV